MKLICLEDSYLVEDRSVKTLVKGSVYTVSNFARDPYPIIKPNGRIVQFPKGRWYQLKETGDLWHHEHKFAVYKEVKEEETPKVVRISINPLADQEALEKLKLKPKAKKKEKAKLKLR